MLWIPNRREDKENHSTIFTKNWLVICKWKGRESRSPTSWRDFSFFKTKKNLILTMFSTDFNSFSERENRNFFVLFYGWLCVSNSGCEKTNKRWLYLNTAKAINGHDGPRGGVTDSYISKGFLINILAFFTHFSYFCRKKLDGAKVFL